MFEIAASLEKFSVTAMYTIRADGKLPPMMLYINNNKMLQIAQNLPGYQNINFEALFNLSFIPASFGIQHNVSGYMTTETMMELIKWFRKSIDSDAVVVYFFDGH